jgi:hypothetical protein
MVYHFSHGNCLVNSVAHRARSYQPWARHAAGVSHSFDRRDPSDVGGYRMSLKDTENQWNITMFNGKTIRKWWFSEFFLMVV